MNINNAERAKVLVHALPYIQKYYGKVVVVKYGGNAMISDKLTDAVMRDIVLLHLIGIKIVLVHGGGPEISDMLKKVGKVPQFVDGLRVTDKETVDIALQILAGKVNKNLVNQIMLKGGKAIGLCGLDGHMIKAEKLDDVHGYVGEITEINTEPILNVFESGYIPVISTVGCDNQGNVYNINADTAAAKIAAALGAESLLLMTDIVGLLRDKDDPSTLIPFVNVEEIPSLEAEGIISGGMIPKIRCCADAVSGGVNKVFIVDGRVPHSILIEILTDEGIGTMITA